MKQIVLTMIFFISFNAYAQNKMIMGYIDVYPLSFIKDGVLTGSSVNYFKNHLAPLMGIKEIKWMSASVPRLLQMLREKKINGILTMNMNKGRLKYGDFPKNAYTSNQSVLVVNKTSKFASGINDVSQFAGVHVLKPAAIHVHKFFKNKKIAFEPIYGNNSWNRMLKLLLLKRCDGIYLPMKETAMAWSSEDREKVIFIEFKETKLPMYMMFNKDSSFVDKYDKAVITLPVDLHRKLTEKQVQK